MSKQSQIDRLWKLQKGMERKHKTWKKCNSNFGKERWGKPEKRRAKSSWKANCSPKEQQISTATLWEATRVKAASCVPNGLPITGWLLLKIRSSWVWWGDTCLYAYFLCASIHITEGRVLPFAEILASLFFLQKGATEPALPHRWFPIKTIHNNVGTLFLERRFVSVPKWAKEEESAATH